MTRDFKNMRKWTPESEEKLEGIEDTMSKWLIWCFIIWIALLVYALLSTPRVLASSNVDPVHESAYAHAISPEMHSYIQDSKIGRNQFVKNEDIE